MLFELVVNVLVGVVGGMFALLGNLPAPGWLTGLVGQLDGLVSAGASMGVWVPWSVMGVVAGAVAACAAISLSVRLFRMLLSLFTGGGGSAA